MGKNNSHVELLKNDRELRLIYLQEALQLLFGKDECNTKTALVMLRDIVNASIGFQGLSQATGKSDKNLMGMLTAGSNPNIDNICTIIREITKYENADIEPNVRSA